MQTTIDGCTGASAHAILWLQVVRRILAPESQLVEETLFSRPLVVGLGIDIAHEEQPLGTITILNRETDTIQRQSDTPPPRYDWTSVVLAR